MFVESMEIRLKCLQLYYNLVAVSVSFSRVCGIVYNLQVVIYTDNFAHCSMRLQFVESWTKSQHLSMLRSFTIATSVTLSGECISAVTINLSGNIRFC